MSQRGFKRFSVQPTCVLALRPRCKHSHSFACALPTIAWWQEDSCTIFGIIDNDRNGYVCKEEFVQHYLANH